MEFAVRISALELLEGRLWDLCNLPVVAGGFVAGGEAAGVAP